MSAALKKPLLATHSGSFHADEAFAVYMLRLTDEYASAELVRTRDPAVLSKADIIVDVGGEYDPSRHRYDHHQREFKETFSAAHDIKLSSAGLVYKHFGRRVIAKILGWNPEDPKIETLYFKIYEDFVMGFDGVDNGINQYPPDIKPRYRDSTTIGSRVASLNPWWNEKDVNLDERFLQAVEMTGKEFTDKVRYLGKSWLPARSIVVDALGTRSKTDPSELIVAFEEFCPWKQHLHQLEKDLGIPESKRPLYVIYPDESGKWRTQAVPKSPDSFESRKPLPEPWRGVRDQELSRLTGIDGCVFVHASGFIGGNETRAGALKMAQEAVAFA